MLNRNRYWRWREMLLLAGLLLPAATRGLAVQTTAIQGIVYRADGSLAQGTVLVSWPAFTAPDGSTIAAGTTSTTIGTDGSVNLALAPNAGANPQGTYYTVVYHMSDGTVQREYWVVPQAATATISQMRAIVVPAAVAQQTVSQQYVDTSISNLQGSYLQLKGGTLTGTLSLAADPTANLQAATKEYVDSAKAAAIAASLPLAGGTLTGPLALNADPSSAMQAATKEYVDAHASAAIPNTTAILKGNGALNSVTTATHTDINALYSSTTYSSSTYTAISTTFNEGSSGSTLIGTHPATDTSGVAWGQNGTSNAKFLSGGGAQFGPANSGSGDTYLQLPAANGTITLTGITLSASPNFAMCIRCNQAYSAGMVFGVSGTTWSLTNYGSTGTTLLGSQTIAGTTGNIVITLNGTTVSINVFGTAMTLSTVPAGDSTITQTYFQVNPNGTVGAGNTATLQMAGLSFTASAMVSSSSTCVGYLNADGTCSTSGANAFVVNDNNGHHVSLPEMGTQTTQATGQAPVTAIAWHDDLKAGVYDPRDPRWGRQDTAAHQAVALQTMENQIACDLSMGVVSHAVARMPQGAWAADNLQIAPGSSFEGTATANGGTHLYSIYNNHALIQAPISMSPTCSDGAVHTYGSGAGVPGTHISHLLLTGCAYGGCSNASGDTGSYNQGGPGNTGLLMATDGIVEWIDAENFGGYGVRLTGQDSKAFHIRTYSDLFYYYYGGYKGFAESAASAEQSAVTTGTTSSVALSWSAVSGAGAYVVYRGTAAGNENVWYYTTGTTFTDTGAPSASGTPHNFSDTNAGAMGTITATPSTTGGTLAAGTYYYKVAAVGVDTWDFYPNGNTNWHGTVEFLGLDVMADWVEAYGQQDVPTTATFHHVADILGGGGDSHFDHLWPQLGINGIVQPYGVGANDHYENFRVDLTEGEGVLNADSGIVFDNGIIDGSCAASNIASINTGSVNIGWEPAGLCDQFYSTNGVTLENIEALNDSGATYKTADFAVPPGPGTYAFNIKGSGTDTNTWQFIPGTGVMTSQNFEPQTYGPVTTTGDGPNVNGRTWLVLNDSSAQTYTGFQYGAPGQDLWIQGGNSNVTLQNNSHIVLCSGANVNLGTIPGFIHLRATTSQTYSGVSNAGTFKEVCATQPASAGSGATVASSETVTYSATPTFSTSTRASIVTLTGNVSSFTLAAGADGQEKTLTFCQDATGSRTVAAPSNVRGFMTVGMSANKCSAQHFTYSAAQSAWLADSPGVVNE